MAKKYEGIQQLIQLWQDFEEINPKGEIQNFAEWLLHTNPTINQKNKRDEELQSHLGETSEVRKEDEDKRLFLDLLSRITRLQDFYTKKLFEGLPLNNMQEFSFLFAVNKQTSFRKKEIINYHHVEYTTGIDIIKRLIRMDLLSEFQDPTDKRSKRLKITSEGKRVLMEALITLKKVEDLFFKDMDQNEWKACLPVLSRLESYHSGIFVRNNTANSAQILDLLK